jgi:hypothetical protein
MGIKIFGRLGGGEGEGWRKGLGEFMKEFGDDWGEIYGFVKAGLFKILI